MATHPASQIPVLPEEDPWDLDDPWSRGAGMTAPEPLAAAAGAANGFCGSHSFCGSSSASPGSSLPVFPGMGAPGLTPAAGMWTGNIQSWWR